MRRTRLDGVWSLQTGLIDTQMAYCAAAKLLFASITVIKLIDAIAISFDCITGCG